MLLLGPVTWLMKILRRSKSFRDSELNWLKSFKLYGPVNALPARAVAERRERARAGSRERAQGCVRWAAAARSPRGAGQGGGGAQRRNRPRARLLSVRGAGKVVAVRDVANKPAHTPEACAGRCKAAGGSARQQRRRAASKATPRTLPVAVAQGVENEPHTFPCAAAGPGGAAERQTRAGRHEALQGGSGAGRQERARTRLRERVWVMKGSGGVQKAGGNMQTARAACRGRGQHAEGAAMCTGHGQRADGGGVVQTAGGVVQWAAAVCTRRGQRANGGGRSGEGAGSVQKARAACRGHAPAGQRPTGGTGVQRVGLACRGAGLACRGAGLAQRAWSGAVCSDEHSLDQKPAGKILR
ncbi:hypothetical protein GGX14DRAFT_398897 [Mycena pura]|uniref:Uncharacterized protein n=1 Tax=Mycena pura TaxID=153505 RepID=A0AAD6V5I1_9AGAR|nr:hypothetical protein GGX14DRAFT_398897 [Mycena pura]